MCQSDTTFNPLFVKEASLASLELLADDLTYFRSGYDSVFAEAFITNLKNEIPALVIEAKKDFDWNSVGNSKQYKTRSMKRAKRKNLNNEDIAADNWMNDPGEKASKIWEWWRVHVYEVENPRLLFMAQAVRIVVLTQLSSCAVERVFSQLNLICETCGDCMMEDMLQIRMFERCNGDLSKVFHDQRQIIY